MRGITPLRQITKLDPDAEKTAADLKIKFSLYENWYLLMNFLKIMIERKTKYKVENPPNELKINDFTLVINFVNNNFLELNVAKKDSEILSIRIPDGQIMEEQGLVILAQILLSIESY